MARMQADPRDNFLSYTTLTRSPPSVNASFAPHANVVMSPTQEYKEYTTVQARTNVGAVWSPHRQYASSYVQSPVIQVRIQMVAHASAWAGFMLYGAGPSERASINTFAGGAPWQAQVLLAARGMGIFSRARRHLTFL